MDRGAWGGYHAWDHKESDTMERLIISPWGFLGGGKEFSYHAGDPGLIPGLGRSPGEGNGYPLQYSCLGNPMDSGAWQATKQQHSACPGSVRYHFSVGR